MAQIYTKIDMTTPGSGIGTVLNLQLCSPTDYFDPTFTWVDITTLTLYCSDGSPIQIGCTYDGTNFIAMPPPPDQGN